MCFMIYNNDGVDLMLFNLKTKNKNMTYAKQKNIKKKRYYMSNTITFFIQHLLYQLFCKVRPTNKCEFHLYKRSDTNMVK